MLDFLFGQYAGWFTGSALIGTIFFLLRLLLPAGDADAPDFHDGGGLDISDGLDHDTPSAFRLLSVQTLCAFLMGFGWAGLAAYRGTGLGPGVSSLIGLAGGAVMMWLLGLLLRSFMRLEGSGNVSIRAAMGREGEVYVTVPGSGGGRGQVRLVIRDRQRIFNAVSAGGALKPPTRVRVIRVNDDHTLTVEPV